MKRKCLLSLPLLILLASLFTPLTVAPQPPIVTDALYVGQISWGPRRTDPVRAYDTFDVYDAEYSFKRGLVQDQLFSPMWMFYKMLFDQMNSDPFDFNTTQPTAMTSVHLIETP